MISPRSHLFFENIRDIIAIDPAEDEFSGRAPILLSLPLNEANPDYILKLVLQQEWPTFEKRLLAKRVTLKELSARLIKDDWKSSNVLGTLAYHKQWKFFVEILNQYLITSKAEDILSVQGQLGQARCSSAFRYMALCLQWDLIRDLLDRKLGTKEQISGRVIKGYHKSTNVLGLLAQHIQWQIVDTLIKNSLVTSEQLGVQETNNDRLEMSVLSMFLTNEWWEKFTILLAQELILSEHLDGGSRNGDNRGPTVLKKLTDRIQWEIIKKLMHKSLILSVHLSFQETTGQNKSHNILGLWVLHKQWYLVLQAFTKGLISSAHLSARSFNSKTGEYGESAYESIIRLAPFDILAIISTHCEKKLEKEIVKKNFHNAQAWFDLIYALLETKQIKDTLNFLLAQNELELFKNKINFLNHYFVKLTDAEMTPKQKHEFIKSFLLAKINNAATAEATEIIANLFQPSKEMEAISKHYLSSCESKLRLFLVRGKISTASKNAWDDLKNELKDIYELKLEKFYQVKI